MFAVQTLTYSAADIGSSQLWLLVVIERQHETADLVAAVDSPVGFDDLGERQHRIDHRPNRSLLGQRRRGCGSGRH